MRVVRTCDFCGDDATGLYEPLPSSIPDGPRLLLCDGCRDRLASVVDPLVEQLERTGERTTNPEGTADSGPRTRDPGSQRSREAATGSSGSREASADDAGLPESPADQPDGAADARGSAASDRAGEPSVSESRDASGRAQPDRAGTPHGYRKVMRFLENRELPVERRQAVQLAGEAYELPDADVERCIDHAVQYGRLREVDGQLKR